MSRKISSIFVLSVAALVTAFSACNKLSKSTAVAPSSDSVIMKSNVVVVDTTKYTLVSSADQLNSGIYVYSYAPSLPAIRHNGDFAPGVTIVGMTGKGYLRKIVSVNAESETITLNTTQGRLEDVFQQGKFSFTTGFASLGNSGNSFVTGLSNRLLYSDEKVTVKIESGNVAINPDWNYSMQFQNGVLTNFGATSTSGSLNATLKLNVNAIGASSFNVTDTLGTVSKTMFRWIGSVPVIITTDIYLIGHAAGNTNGLLNNTVTVTNSNNFNVATTYAAGTWQNNYHFTPVSSLTGNVSSGGHAMEASINIVPVMDVRFYGAIASAASFPLNTNMTGNMSATTSDWDFVADYKSLHAISENAAVLGYSMPDFNDVKSEDSATYNTPVLVVKTSGDFQYGPGGQYLAQPITVKVTDSKGNVQAGVPVHFTVLTGSGSLTYDMMASDGNGMARGYWKLGYGGGVQTVQVAVRKSNGSNISGSPIIFTAN